MDTIQELNCSSTDGTIAYRKANLNDAIGHQTTTFSGPLYGGFAIPLKSAVGTVRDKVLTDLDPSTFDGHAPIALTWNTAVLDETGEPYVLADRITIIPTGHATIGSQEVTGIAIVGSDSVTLMLARDLITPITVNENTPLRVDITVGLAPAVNPG